MSGKSIFKMFGSSPIHPLQEHMIKVYESVTKLQPFFTAAAHNDWETAEKIQQQIVQLEHEADDLKRNLRLNLPKGLFMPVQRSDILVLIGLQDRLANKAKDIAGLVLGRKMVIPEPAQENYMQFLNRCLDAAKQANKAIRELDQVLEAGFSGKEIDIVEGMVDKLLKIESDTDLLQIEVRRIIFGLENKLPPVGVVFIYKILEWTGDLAGHAQHIGDRLQILIAR